MPLSAGVATREITPQKPLFLVGYPHVPRISAGVNDPLFATALCLDDGNTQLLFITVDLLLVERSLTAACRAAITRATGIPANHIVLSATHTHSAPVTSSVLAWKNDPIVPAPDAAYMEFLETQIIAVGIAAHAARQPAELAVTAAHVNGVGGNRLDPKNGAFDSEAGLLVVRRRSDHQVIGVSVNYGMHPTVLHEDTKLVSNDFFGYMRQELARSYPGLTTLIHLGPCGNCSTRYDVKGATVAEAERLGRKLAQFIIAALRAIPNKSFRTDVTLDVAGALVDLVPNSFSSLEDAAKKLRDAQARYATLQAEGAPHGPVRTAECAVFGAEEAVALAEAQAAGNLAAWQARCNPAEIQAFRVGDVMLVTWPGECFVEYGIELKRRAPLRTFVIELANDHLQGYLVTPEAAAAGGYEAAFALFRPESARRIVEASLKLIDRLRSDS